MDFLTFAEMWIEDHSLRLPPTTVRMNAEMYFPGVPNAERKAQRRLDKLEKRGLAIKKQFVASLPSPKILRPQIVLDPATSPKLPPHFHAGKLSNASISRYRRCTPGTVTLYTASARARRIAGGPELREGFIGRPFQTDHDLIMAKACCLMRRERPKLFKDLRTETVYQRFYHLRRDKLPDALVCGSDYENPIVVLDSISRYHAAAIMQLVDRWIEDPPVGFKPTRLELY